MDFAETLRFLDGRQEAKWKLGLARIEALLGGLGRPERDLRCVHIAGTNGKGSVSAFLAAILREAGLRPGLFTSPHLASPRERIRVDGEPIGEADFARCVTKAKLAEPEEATYFELVTAAAFLHFRERECGVCVIETGLGGRLDATNAIERPALTVITSVDLDHTRQLGETRAAIAAEKCGILKEGAVCVTGEDDYEPLKVIRRRAYEAAAPLVVHRCDLKSLRTDWEGGFQEAVREDGRRLRVGLLGEAALRNASLALRAAGELREAGFAISPEAEARGLASVDWPCRFQPVRAGGRTIVLDGAHNPASMRAFVRTWKASPWAGPDAMLLAGMLADKDCAELCRMLAPLARRMIAATAPSPRALPAAELAGMLRAAGCPDVAAVPDPAEAWERLKSADAPAAAATGSLYLVGRLWDLQRKAPV